MIPARIHMIWLNRDAADEAIPEPYKQFIEGWREQHADWEVNVYQNRDIERECPILAQTLLKKLAKGSHPAMVADLMRAEIVHRKGGFYIDADIECVKNLEPLRACDTLVVHEVKNSKAIASGIFADREQGLFTKLLLEDIQAAGNNLQGGSILAWTRVKERLLAEHPENHTVSLAPESFFPFYSTYVPETLTLSPNCYGIHWYAATWMGVDSKHHQSFRRALRRLRGLDVA